MSSTYRIIVIVVLVLLIMASAFFSAAETAYSFVSTAKIEALAARQNKAAKLIKKHRKSFGWTLSTILISNNLVNVALSSLSTYLISDLIGLGARDALIATLIVTPILVIFGEISPKILARKYPFKYLSKVAYVMNFLNYMFFPITYPLSKITLQSKITNTENDIKTLLGLARKEGVIEDNEATLAQKALDLDSIVVSRIMTKRDKIVFVKSTAKIIDLKKVFKRTGHSRILVSRGSQFIGIVLLKDVFTFEDNEKIIDYIKPIAHVSKSMLVSRALEKMRIDNAQIAIVQKSLHSTQTVGIITLEDIIEELIGEVYDEHDKFGKIKEIAHHKYVALGSAKMSDLESTIKVKFDKSKGLTIKQWIQSRITRKISKNLKYHYKNKVIFRVLENNNMQETKIEITLKLSVL